VVVSDSVAAEGGGVYHDDGGVLTMTGGRIVDNLAGHRGGGLFITGTSSADLLNVLVAGTAAPDNQGGGVRSFNGDVTATSCVFADNVANEGGGVYVTGTTTFPITLTLDHVTAAFNQGKAAAGGAFVKIGTNTAGVLIDTVIADNGGTEAVAERTDSV
jgi:predicted outer membrane repeat protein